MSGYAGLSLYNAGINKLKSFNPDIENINLIYVGQTLILQGTAAKKTTTKAQRPKITAFGLQSGTANSNNISEITIYATWSWDQGNTEEYKIMWKYATGDGVGWVHTDSTTTYKYSTCSNIPANATHVTFQVKPISKTYKKGDKETHYWTADWSTKQTYWFKDNPPITPPIDSATIEVTEATKTSWIDKISGVVNDVIEGVTGSTSSTTVSSSTKPAEVTVKLDGLEVAENSGLYLNAHEIQFQFLKNDKTVYKTVRAQITKGGSASCTCTLTSGDEFKVRCRSYRGKVTGSDNTKYSTSQGVYSDWSGYSEVFGTAPSATQGIHTLYPWKNSAGEWVVRIGWYGDDKNKYTVGYTTEKEYFGSNPSGITTSSTETTGVHYMDIPISETGKELFFAVKTDSVSYGSSIWSDIKSLIIGSKPSQPTTWSSSSTAMVNDQVVLYWTHQTSDGSPESAAKLDISINDIHVTKNENDEYVENTTHSDVDPDAGNYIYVQKEKDEYGQVISSTSSYALSFPSEYFIEGAIVKWRVRTAGVYTDNDGDLVYSDWSETRQINVYAEPTISLAATIPVTSNGITTNVPIGVNEDIDEDGTLMETPVLHFPITVDVESEVNTAFQKPVGYYISVSAVHDYETIDVTGNVKMVKAGEAVFSQHYDSSSTKIACELSAGNIDLENGQEYVLTCTASMDSGLSGEQSLQFLVSWTDEETWPNLEITYDKDTYTTTLRPYCIELDGSLIDGVTLFVYRREFDGTLTALNEVGISNTDEVYITDPHPSLDYARYRVVAITDSTGAVSFYDVPNFPINEKGMIIQWDEEWTDFSSYQSADAAYDLFENDGYAIEERPWEGSLLRLLYNIDVSDSHDPEVELVKYIGRENPVGYYGTQRGHSSVWSTEIPKSDTETLYAIRRLSRWMGNVYVREPSGSGYWANIKVSYSQKHKELTIPITLTVTRVDE